MTPSHDPRISRPIATEISARPDQVAAAVALLDEGATVPFVARYRKEATGGLDDTQLRTLSERLSYLREMEARRGVIVESIRSQEKLTEGLEKAILGAETKAVLEDLYLPFKPKRRTKAMIARENGLEPLAEAIVADRAADPEVLAAAYVTEAVADVKAALEGAREIIAERLVEDAGLKAQFGTMAKPLNAGLAAEAGVEAALWAMAGMTSTEQGLQAFGATHHGGADAAAFDGLGGTWRMLEVSHKFHACCHGLHAMLEALSEVSVDPADVVSVEITTHPRWMTVCNKPAPHTGLEAKFSYAQTAAMALVGVDTSAIAAFSDMVAQRPDLVALRDVVTVVTAESLTEMQARVRITLRDGAVLDAAHDLAAPMTLEARAARLMRKAQGLLPDADALWQVTDLASLAAILRA